MRKEGLDYELSLITHQPTHPLGFDGDRWRTGARVQTENSTWRFSVCGAPRACVRACVRVSAVTSRSTRKAANCELEKCV